MEGGLDNVNGLGDGVLETTTLTSSKLNVLFKIVKTVYKNGFSFDFPSSYDECSVFRK